MPHVWFNDIDGRTKLHCNETVMYSVFQWTIKHMNNGTVSVMKILLQNKFV